MTCHFRSTFYVAKSQTATAKMSAALKPLPLRPPNLGDKLAWTLSCTQLQSLVPCDISRVAAMPRGKQLCPKTWGKIEALHSVGDSVRQIAAFVRRSRNSVHQCLHRLSHGSSDYEKRPGRGKATTIWEDHRLKRMTLQNRRAPSRLLSYQLAHESGKQVSSRTVRRRLSETRVNARRPRKNHCQQKTIGICDWDGQPLTHNGLWMTGNLFFLQMSQKSA